MREACNDAGFCLEEQAVPELGLVEKKLPNGEVTMMEAVLDTVAFGHAYHRSILIDGTFRHVYTGKTSGRAAWKPGLAAARGEADKQRRYKPRHGRAVVTAAAESFGRFGQELDELIRFLDKHK